MAVQTSVTEMGRFAEVLEKLVKTVGSLQVCKKDFSFLNWPCKIMIWWAI